MRRKMSDPQTHRRFCGLLFSQQFAGKKAAEHVVLSAAIWQNFFV